MREWVLEFYVISSFEASTSRLVEATTSQVLLLGRAAVTRASQGYIWQRSEIDRLGEDDHYFRSSSPQATR